MNTAQKIAVGTWAAAAIAVTFLHNPTEGWTGTQSIPQSLEIPIWSRATPECQQSSLQKWYDSEPLAELAKLQATGTATSDEYEALRKRTLDRNKLTALCLSWHQTYYDAQPRPISEWYSEKAFLPMLREVSSFLWAQLCLAVLALIALTLSRQGAAVASVERFPVPPPSTDNR